MGLTPSQRAWLVREVLREVSRAFYLSLWILPTRLREPLGLTYLVARAADTIADTEALPPAQRRAQLESLRRQVVEGSDPALQRALADQVASLSVHAGERRLLLSLDLALQGLHQLSPSDLEAAREVLMTLTDGMLEDLDRFPPGELGSLSSPSELDRYTYLVAGCVGPFWTRVLKAHTPALAGWDLEEMCALGRTFGQALQLVNVLRDVPGDLRRGRCYLPAQDLARFGLVARDLLSPRNDLRARPVLAHWTRVALDHFRRAERYALAIPARCIRLRLAALWPILLGLATLERLLRQPTWLGAARPVKVGRGQVYRILLVSTLFVMADRHLQAWFEQLHGRVEGALGGY